MSQRDESANLTATELEALIARQLPTMPGKAEGKSKSPPAALARQPKRDPRVRRCRGRR